MGTQVDNVYSGSEQKLIDDELFSIMWENITDYALVILDPRGMIIGWNKGASKLKGYTKEEALNKSFSIFYTPEDIRRNKPKINLQKSRENGTFVEEGVRKRKDGSLFIASISITALRNSNGELKGYAKVIKDITQQKIAEEQLIQKDEQLRVINEKLEQKVEERTLQLTMLNETLQKEINERKEAEAKIESSLKEKEILLKEIHHRVKNNLQIISSLLNIQADYINDEKLLEIFVESRNRVKSMALIHEKLYQSEDIAYINFSDYITELTWSLFKTYNYSTDKVKLQFKLEKIFFGIDQGITLGLLLNELISNAFKHAFPDKSGTLKIKTSRRDDSYIFIIQDDGIGLPAGFDRENINTLGLQLIITLVDQIKGNITFINDNGTKVRIEFPSVLPF